jgi:hypothetical protein
LALRARQWKTLCKRAGVRYRPLGQMRHTFAPISLMAGESLQWVASQRYPRENGCQVFRGCNFGPMHCESLLLGC